MGYKVSLLYIKTNAEKYQKNKMSIELKHPVIFNPSAIVNWMSFAISYAVIIL